MRKLFLIVRSNLRRAKGQTISIIVLMMIAAMLFNLWLMLDMDYRANFDRYHDKLNAEHVTITINDENGDVLNFLSDALDKDSSVSQYVLDSCMHMSATFPYIGGEMNSFFIFMTKETALSRAVGRAEIVEEGNCSSGIYLPMIYKSEDIKVGNTLNISIGSHTIEYIICGFFNSVMTGSHNCGLTAILLTEDKYAELEASGYAYKSTLCSVRIYDKTENLNYEAKLKSLISENFPGLNMVSNGYDMVAQARYISQMICSRIISVMAFFVLLIALVVIFSNIVNYIQVNLKNLGVLKATGYTSRQLIASLLLQFISISLVASITGIALSYAVFPAINVMMISQTGIPYAIRFLFVPFIIDLVVLVGAVALSVWLASRQIRKVEPIIALRSGLQTHNFKKNYIPLENTKVHLNVALALKTTLSGLKHNITVCITMLVVSLVVVFSGLLIENAFINITPFLNLIVGETADSCINVNAEAESEFLNEMNADSRVEKYYLYTTTNVTHKDGAELLVTICDDFSKVNHQGGLYIGRFPKYDNEIAIGVKYAKEKGFEVGNEIEIIANGKNEKYLISGLTQITNYLGRDALLTRTGYERLGEITSTTYNINLTEETNIDEFNTEMKEKFSNDVNAAINFQTTLESASSVYLSLLVVIVIGILVLSVIIIAFVLYLLVRTMLNNKKRDYGVFEALGFTTKQLILQTALSFMPAVTISMVIGITIGCLVINPLMSLFLSGLGIMKCTFTIPIAFGIGAGMSIILLSFGLVCVLSLNIKKIAPRNLLVGE